MTTPPKVPDTERPDIPVGRHIVRWLRPVNDDTVRFQLLRNTRTGVLWCRAQCFPSCTNVLMYTDIPAPEDEEGEVHLTEAALDAAERQLLGEVETFLRDYPELDVRLHPKIRYQTPLPGSDTDAQPVVSPHH